MKNRNPGSQKTNVQFLAGLMKDDVLVQAFVIEGVAKYADLVAKSNPAEYERSLINGPAWIATATKIQSAIKARFTLKEVV